MGISRKELHLEIPDGFELWEIPDRMFTHRGPSGDSLARQGVNYVRVRSVERIEKAGGGYVKGKSIEIGRVNTRSGFGTVIPCPSFRERFPELACREILRLPTNRDRPICYYVIKKVGVDLMHADRVTDNSIQTSDKSIFLKSHVVSRLIGINKHLDLEQVKNGPDLSEGDLINGEIKFELCATSLQGCVIAEEKRLSRVELCQDLAEGGITPSFSLIKMAREVLTHVGLNVLIRPRGGDFCYNEDEIKMMEQDIIMAISLGADGVVIGALTQDGKVDVETVKRLCSAAYNAAAALNIERRISITFHRAFDQVADQFEALEQIIELGHISRILTSGGHKTALEGMEKLQALNQAAAGRIILMAGAGINDENINELIDNSTLEEFHFSAKAMQESAYQVQGNACMGSDSKSDLMYNITDRNLVQKIIGPYRQSRVNALVE